MPKHVIHSNAYTDTLQGRLPVPTSGTERLAFQTLMVFCMVTCMVTFNWLLHTPHPTPGAFSQILYEYPLTFVIALCIRTLVANPFVGHITTALVPQNLAGFKRTVVMTSINVGTMVTIMTFFGVLISNASGGFTWFEYITSLPIAYVVAFTINLLAVGPFVKIVYAHAIKPGMFFAHSKVTKLRRTFISFMLRIFANKGE